MIFEDKFIYQPLKFPLGIWELQQEFSSEKQIIPKIQDIYFKTIDNINIHAWYCSPIYKNKEVKTENIFLWFHGNAGNLSHRLELIFNLVKIPAHIFMIDYRGYGKSEGKPSEEGLYLDAYSAWEYLQKNLNIIKEKIIIAGESLGGAIAIDLASKVNPTGLIAQSTFSSIPDMASIVMPFIPKKFIKTQMNSLEKIKRIKCPKLIIHGLNDEIVPYEFGLKLFEEAEEKKELYTVENAGHNEIYLIEGSSYLQKLKEFAEMCNNSIKIKNL